MSKRSPIVSRERIYVNHFHVVGDGQSRPTLIVRAICIQPDGDGTDDRFAETMAKIGKLATAYIRKQFGDGARYALPAETNSDEIPRAVRVMSNALEVNWLVWGFDTEPFGE